VIVGVDTQREGIFRVSGQVGNEGAVRRQLARGIVPESLDVHALAGLIKVSWFASGSQLAAGSGSTHWAAQFSPYAGGQGEHGQRLVACPVLMMLSCSAAMLWPLQAWFRELPSGILDAVSPLRWPP